jgi:hypothetical protein
MRWSIAILCLLPMCATHGQSLLPTQAKMYSLLRPAPLAPTPTTLPSPWAYEHLGMFCKLDVQLERRAKFPVVFRLGDVQQVEAWEGKGPMRIGSRLQ